MAEYQFTSPRLGLRPACEQDAAWIYELNNDPIWVKYIGNRNVHSMADARRYIAHIRGHLDQWGYGLWVVERQDSSIPLGLCGLLTRGVFTAPDLGFGFLAEHRGKGLAQEACKTVLQAARQHYQFTYVTAMTHPENKASQQLLGRLGFASRGNLFMPGLPRQRLYWRHLNTD